MLVAEEVLDRVHADARAAATKRLRRRAVGIAGLGVLALGGLATARQRYSRARARLRVALTAS